AALDRVHEMALDRVFLGERDVVAALHHARAAALAEQALHRDRDRERRIGLVRVQRGEEPRAARAEDQDVGGKVAQSLRVRGGPCLPLRFFRRHFNKAQAAKKQFAFSIETLSPSWTTASLGYSEINYVPQCHGMKAHPSCPEQPKRRTWGLRRTFVDRLKP